MNHHAIVEILLKKIGVISGDIGHDLLFKAAQRGQSEIVNILLTAGVTTDRQESDVSVVYIATQNHHTSVVSQLLTAGLNPNAARADGTTPLFIAAEQGWVDIMEVLLMFNAKIDTARSDGVTPFIIAAGFNRMGAVELLLRSGGISMSSCERAFIVASERGHEEIAQTIAFAVAQIQGVRRS
jgi:ankyrin repeat protein